jgi:hypothetical protein
MMSLSIQQSARYKRKSILHNISTLLLIYEYFIILIIIKVITSKIMKFTWNVVHMRVYEKWLNNFSRNTRSEEITWEA